MENFFLWSVSYRPGQPHLSFFASPVHVQGIGKGTQEMLAEMLKDLGGEGLHPVNWSVRHVVTDYLTDDAKSTDLAERFRDAWEITVETSEPVNLDVEPTDLISTWAGDSTWKLSQAPYLLPAELFVVADFPTQESAEQARQRLSRFGEVCMRPGLPGQLVIHLGEYDEDTFPNGAKLCFEAEQTCRSMGGTTTWNEKAQ